MAIKKGTLNNATTTTIVRLGCRFRASKADREETAREATKLEEVVPKLVLKNLVV